LNIGKNVLGFSMFMGSAMTLLAAPSAELGYGFLIACRFVNGLVHVSLYCFKLVKQHFKLDNKNFKGIGMASYFRYFYSMGTFG
jgi:hypothetical protein